MPTILVVDDEPGIRLLYSAELTDEGYQIITARKQRALEDLQIDMVVLNIHIKLESGLDRLQTIIKEKAELPIIFCSAYNCYKDDF